MNDQLIVYLKFVKCFINSKRDTVTILINSTFKVEALAKRLQKTELKKIMRPTLLI